MGDQKIIGKERGAVFGGETAWDHLNTILSKIQPSRLFVLTDENTRTHCLPYFIKKIPIAQDAEVLSMPAGESHKNITTCQQLWQELSSKGADRKSLLINLGGGVVTDLGGFVASTFQRGIEFINVPTSLLAMVDASVGGKNGVDLGMLKNQVGIIRNPKAVILDTAFLETLPQAHFNSGITEMIKHGLIHSEAYLRKVMEMDKSPVDDLVWESVLIKNEVVSKDPTEQGLRKTLNYGHTLGHAIESFRLRSGAYKTLLHGEAVAVGLILANYLSHRLFGFPKSVLDASATYLIGIFGKEHFGGNEIEEIIKLLIFDKKNTDGKVQFVLLEKVGAHRLNCEVEDKLIHESFEFYKNF
ncbi:MAG: 3-dehydroquinate synthase [Bacteroidia bacterium]|nr:3-dehydroquinate synthase [Bacteroidia bacterium]